MPAEWDSRKAKVNKRKHGVTFEEAALVFGDPLALIDDDSHHEDGREIILESPILHGVICCSSSSSKFVTRLFGSSAPVTPQLPRGVVMKKSGKKKAAKALTVEHPRGKMAPADFPELNAKAKLKPNRFAAKIARDGGYWVKAEGKEPRWVPYKRDGRPRKGETSEASKVRSVRLPDSVWEELQARAKRRGVGVHTLLRELVAKYLSRAA